MSAETTTRNYNRKPSNTKGKNKNIKNSPSKYFQTKKRNYYDPFSFQSTERSPAVEKYLQYKRQQQQQQNSVYSNRLDSRFSVSQSGPRTQPRPRPRPTNPPLVLSYEEAIRARTQARTPPPTTPPPPPRQQGAESRYGVGGYQGGARPVFVSQSERENVAMRRRLPTRPTPPPRNYFPVLAADYEDTEDYSITGNRIDEIDDGYGITTYLYNDDLSSPATTPGYYSSEAPPPPPAWVTPRPAPAPAYYAEDNIWAGYDKVVADLLASGDKKYSSNNNKYDSYNNNQYDTYNSNNKFVGQPQAVSTRPLIVSPGMDTAASHRGHEAVLTQPSPALLSSYSDRYGWGESNTNMYTQHRSLPQPLIVLQTILRFSLSQRRPLLGPTSPFTFKTLC